MVRPRALTDDQILDAIATTLAGRMSSGTWTLAEVAPAAGMTAPGLLKRFGSRTQLVEAMWQRWFASIPTEVIGDVPPERELREYLRSAFTIGVGESGQLAVIALLDDLRTPAAAALLRHGWNLQAEYVAKLLALMKPSQVADEATAARVLLDAVLGRVLRAASQITVESTVPDETVDYFLEIWK